MKKASAIPTLGNIESPYLIDASISTEATAYTLKNVTTCKRDAANEELLCVGRTATIIIEKPKSDKP